MTEAFTLFVELLRRRLGHRAPGAAWRMLEAMEDAGGSFVYFIRMGSGEDAPVKVGSAKDVEKRLGELQVGNPVALRVVDRLSGGQALERGAPRLRGLLPATFYPGEEEHVAVAALRGAAASID